MKKILLVDDHYSVIDGLKSMLEKENDFEIIGEAQDAKTAMQLIHKLRPDIVILDVDLHGVFGTTITEKIVKEYKAKVIAFSGHDNIEYIQQMLLAGASGYVLKGGERREIVRAIRKAIENKTYLCEGLTHLIVQDYTDRLETINRELSLLTVREKETIQLIASGMTRHDIAEYLGVEAGTVSTHRNSAMKKLGLKSTADIARYIKINK